MARDFDGVDDNIEDADGEDYINGLSSFSISMFIKSDVISTNNGFFRAKTVSTSNDDFTIRYDSAGFSGGGTNVIKYAVEITSGVSAGESASNVQTTDLQHIVMTWTSGEAVKLYIDGVETTPTSAPASRTGTTTAATLVSIGVAQKGPEFWDGDIAEVGILDVVLTATQIGALFRGANLFGFGIHDNLQTYYPIYGNDSSEPDFSGNDHDGVLTGTTKTIHPPVEPLENYL